MTDNTPLAVCYYLNGVNFRMSAEKLAEGLELDDAGRPIKLTAVPLYYLASHAAELFLKAALLKRGCTERDLRKNNRQHNVALLLDEIQNKKIPVTNETVAVVQGLSEQHRNHQLRYTVLVADGAKTYWPPVSLVFGALDELLSLTRITTHGV